MSECFLFLTPTKVVNIQIPTKVACLFFYKGVILGQQNEAITKIQKNGKRKVF